jgi:predicted nucleic acid-binding protein
VILLDTNVLTAITSAAHPHGGVARAAVHRLLAGGERLAIFPQTLYEFWAVATRKPGSPPTGQNGLVMTVERSSRWLAFFRRRFAFLPDRDELPTRWHELVRAHAIRGFRAHDARLVAAMRCYGITRLLTFNGKDFAALGVTVVDRATA